MGAPNIKDRSSGNYRDIFDNIIDSVCILDRNGKIMDVNTAMLEISGYSREELLGKNVQEMVPPEDRAASESTFKQLRETGSYEGYTGRFLDKKGKIRVVEITSKAFYDEHGELQGSRDIIRDVTEKKLMETQLMESEQRFRTIVTNSESIIFMLDREGIFTLSEGKGLTALGLAPGEVVGSSVYDIYGDNPEIIQAVRVALGGNSSKVIVSLGELQFDTFFSPFLGPEGDCKGVIGMAVDITERVRKAEELELARRKAEESDHLKSTFLANLSHEIRTPMNAILGFSALLGNGGLSEEDKNNYMEIIQTKGNELLQMLTDLIDISKIEAGLITLNKEQIHLNRLLEEYLLVAEQELVIRGRERIEIRHSIPMAQVIIYNDPYKLRQVLNNLLNNAIKFTREGSIEFGFHMEPNQVSIFVKDTGIGIEEQQQEIIFDRFRQVDDAQNLNAGGTGLGLYISKTLISHMGGDLTVQSMPGKGSIFRISLPI